MFEISQRTNLFVKPEAPSYLGAMSTLADRLKRARAHAGINQAELAERVRPMIGTGKAKSFSQQTISAIERGLVSESGFSVHIARALGVSPEWLVLGVGEMEPPEREGNGTESETFLGVRMVPVLPWAALGEPPGAVTPIREIPTVHKTNNMLIALRVRDDAMATAATPSFPQGAYIVCDMDAPCAHADFVIAIVHGAPLFRQLLDEGPRRALRALNAQFPMQWLEDGDRIIARVVGLWMDVTTPEDA